MSEDKIRELFPSSARLAIGGTDIKGTNTVEQYQNALPVSYTHLTLPTKA